MTTDVSVHSGPELARAAAALLLGQLAAAQKARGEASVVLTGGRSGAAIYEAVRSSPDLDMVDWSHVDIWWGDERFLPVGDPDRNETQARAALLDAIPLDLARVHPMPASDGPDGDDPDAAAARYAAELAAAAGSGGLPHFDLLLLGVGEEGHVASLFPDAPAGNGTSPVIAVLDCPKPPPVRITLTPGAINTADEVWLIATGPAKADAVGQALGGTALPAARVHGRQRTRWMLDDGAAAQLPPGLRAEG